MLKLIQKSLFVFLVFFGLSTPVVYAQSATGVIMRVVDGDTVDIWVNNELQRVRIIGLDTPETVNPRKNSVFWKRSICPSQRTYACRIRSNS